MSQSYQDWPRQESSMKDKYEGGRGRSTIYMISKCLPQAISCVYVVCTFTHMQTESQNHKVEILSIIKINITVRGKCQAMTSK